MNKRTLFCFDRYRSFYFVCLKDRIKTPIVSLRRAQVVLRPSEDSKSFLTGLSEDPTPGAE